MAAGNGEEDLEPATAARNVAIISDGNARWARARGLTLAEGHEAAADIVIARVDDALELGVRQLTLYSFSTENWTRPAGEVTSLMALHEQRIAADAPHMDEEGIQIRFIGRRTGIAARLAERIEWAEARTAENRRMTLFVAFNYGGRAEIVDAAQRFEGTTEHEFRQALYAPDMHDPDVIIRTGGERRLSNYLLWQSAYAELVFRDEPWPDFSRCAFEASLAEYTARQRRFGGR